jgi:hypothetical protein
MRDKLSKIVPRLLTEYEKVRHRRVMEARKRRKEAKRKELTTADVVKVFSRQGAYQNWRNRFDEDELRRKKKEEDARAKLNKDVAGMDPSEKKRILVAYQKKGK